MQGTDPGSGSVQRRLKTESEGQFVAASFITLANKHLPSQRSTAIQRKQRSL